MVRSFASAKPQHANLLTAITSTVDEAVRNDTTTTHNLLLSIQCMVTETHALESFKQHIQEQREVDATWHLWSNYVLNDCFGYVGLFLSIRNSDWDLQIASIKNIAALFSAYDRPCYQKLVPDHLADLQAYPPQVIDFFKAGGFTVKVKGRVGHAIALDEAHEMCINRDIKMAVVRPTQPYLKKTTHFFSYRIKAQKQFLSQLFPPTAEASPAFKLLDQSSGARMRDENVEKMRSLISEHNVYTPPADTNRGLLNVFHWKPSHGGASS